MDLYHDEYSTYYHYDLPDINWDIKYPTDDEESTDNTSFPVGETNTATNDTNGVIELPSSDEDEEKSYEQPKKKQRVIEKPVVQNLVQENEIVIDDDDVDADVQNNTDVIIELDDNEEMDYDDDDDDEGIAVEAVEQDEIDDEYEAGYEAGYHQGRPLNYELSYEIETADGSGEDDYKGENLENESGTYRCPMCPKEVVSKYNLKRHCMLHTGEKPYPCQICNKAFRELSDLRKHLKVHEEGTKVFECSTCFRSYKSFKTNRCYFCEGEEDEDMPPPTNYEDPNKLYRCFLCNKTRLTTLELKKHLRRDHPATSRVPWNPNGIENVTSNVDSLDSLYTCNTCSKTFRNKQFLMLHALTHANNRVERVS